MDLTTARTRVLALADDDDGSRFNVDGTFAVVDDALKTAQIEAWTEAVGTGSSSLVQEVSITTSSAGVADLTTIKPLRIDNVALSQSNIRLNVPPARFDQAPTSALISRTLLIALVTRAAFPSAPSGVFVWGHANLADASPVLDKLMIAIAASELKIKDNEPNPGLEKRKAELRASVESALSIPTWSVLPLDSITGVDNNDSGFSWIMTAPDTLQLVLA